MNKEDDLRATSDIQVKNETSEQTVEVRNESPQIDVNLQKNTEEKPLPANDVVEDATTGSNIEINFDENLNTENPPPRVNTEGVEVKNEQPANNIQQGNQEQQVDNIVPPKQEAANNQVEEPRQPAQQDVQQNAPARPESRRLTRQELFAKRQEDLIKSSGVPIAAIQGARGVTYITQSEEGKFYALAQGPRGIRRVALDKSFRPEDLWQNPRATINPNVAFDPVTGRFKAIQQEQQVAAGQQGAQLPAQVGGNVQDPGVANREQFNNIPQPRENIPPPRENIPQPRENDRQGNEPNRIAVVKLQPGTRFRFYEDTMTLVVE